MQNGNLDIWDKVRTPDPKYTKAFSKGGGFKGTSTNATYLAKVATELFGPNGKGWGLDILAEDYRQGAPILNGDGSAIAHEIIHVVRCRVWYVLDGEKYESSAQFGQTQFVGKNKNGIYTDEEAPKKSVTDAMLKCFSLLGFSADIFMGLWDDSKYVAEVTQKVEAEKPKPILMVDTPAFFRAVEIYRAEESLEKVRAKMEVSQDVALKIFEAAKEAK